MKFRAKTTDLQFVRTFAHLLSALSRCSRNFILRITSDKLIFVLSDKEAANANSVVSAWGEIPKEPYFEEYAMEGVSSKDNEIYLEISPEKIANCLSLLRSSHSVAALKIKLTKKVVACLTFEIEFQSANSAPTCIHDVPVTLVIRRMWNLYKEPDVGDIDLTIGMPDLKHVRLALERMKNLEHRLRITATSNGALALSVESYNVKCVVRFKDLKVFDLGAAGIGAGDMEEMEVQTQENSSVKTFSVEVDMKTIMHALSSDLQRPTTFFFNLCSDHRLHTFFTFGNITLQYCIPSIGDHS